MLSTQPEPLHERAVPREIVVAQVRQQPPPLAHHLQQAASRVKVVLVNLEMLAQVSDPCGQPGDLNIRRSRVIRMSPELLCRNARRPRTLGAQALHLLNNSINLRGRDTAGAAAAPASRCIIISYAPP